MCPAAFLARRRRRDGCHSVGDQVGQFKRFHQVRVPNKAAVGDLNVRPLARNLVHRNLARLQRLVFTENSGVFLHGLLHFHAQFCGGRAALGVAGVVETVQSGLNRRRVRRGHGAVGVHDLARADRRGTAKDHKVDQRVRAKPVRAVHRGTARLAHGHQAGCDAIGFVLGRRQHFAPIVRRDTAHVIVHGRDHGDRFLVQVHTCEHPRAFRNTRQAQFQRLGRQVGQVQVDVVTVLADTAAFADFHRHAAADIVAGREVFILGRVTLHEPFAFGVGQIATLAARTFCDQAARTIDAGGVELHEFHVLQRQTRTRHHAATVAGAGVGAGCAEIGAAIAAGGQHDHLGAEQVQGAVVQLPAHHALAFALFGHDQVDGEIFDEELGLLLQRLAVQRVQNRVAGPVGSGACALHGGAFAEFGGVAAERALVNLALVGARERHAVMFQLVNRLGRFAGQIFHRIRIAQPVRPLDGVVHVPLPVVGAHVGQRRGNAALCGNGVRAGREHFGHASGAQALFGHAQRRTQTSATGAYDDDVVFVCFIFICSH